MKIKDIIVKEAAVSEPISGTVTQATDKKIVVKDPKGNEFAIDPNTVTTGPDGKLQATTQIPSITTGAQISLIPSQPNQPTPNQPTPNQPTPNQPTPNQPTPNTTSSEIKMAEVSDDDLSNLEELSDNDLIALARDNGIEAKLDDHNKLINRNELIDLLQSGADISGDPADDFIDDTVDKEYGQMMERIKQLSGLRCV